MRYHIDTIPVLDALKQGGECPLCRLRRKVERTDIDRFLGASVMEPDTRLRVNATGFCQRHQSLLFAQPNRLGHALMTHTRLIEVEKQLLPVLARAKNGRAGSVFQRGASPMRAAADAVRGVTGGCVICESVEDNMRRYAFTFLHLYKTDDAFRKAFRASRGVCLKDLALLFDMADEALSAKEGQAFAEDLEKIETAYLKKLENDIEWFTLKFDYRNAEKPWNDSKDALERTVNYLRGQCVGEVRDE